VRWRSTTVVVMAFRGERLTAIGWLGDWVLNGSGTVYSYKHCTSGRANKSMRDGGTHDAATFVNSTTL
jgi:hypothetical protein